jgi:hypothetical protein
MIADKWERHTDSEGNGYTVISTENNLDAANRMAAEIREAAQKAALRRERVVSWDAKPRNDWERKFKKR